MGRVFLNEWDGMVEVVDKFEEVEREEREEEEREENQLKEPDTDEEREEEEKEDENEEWENDSLFQHMVGFAMESSD